MSARVAGPPPRARRLVDRPQHLVQPAGGQAGDAGGVGHRLQLRALALDIVQRLAQRMRHHPDVREQDGRVQPVAADRLQRHLGGQLGVVAEIQEAAGPGPGGVVFRQVALGLAHQPHRRPGLGLARQGAEEGRHHSSRGGDRDGEGGPDVAQRLDQPGHLQIVMQRRRGDAQPFRPARHGRVVDRLDIDAVPVQ